MGTKVNKVAEQRVRDNIQLMQDAIANFKKFPELAKKHPEKLVNLRKKLKGFRAELYEILRPTLPS